MSSEPLPCPEPPDWRVPWEMLEARFDAEGVRLQHRTCEVLAGMPAWRRLPSEERGVVFTAALLLGAGEVPARQVLWRLGVPLVTRESIVSAVRYHALPFVALGRDDCQFRIFEASQSVRCDHLALLAEAAVQRGDPERALDEVHLFREWCAEQGCLTGPRRFGSDHARFEYFHRPGGDPDYVPHEAFRCEVVLMSGLPGVGKDHWVQTHLPDWPVVSLDAWRERLGLSPSDDPGAVVTRAREEAREHLRKGRSFVWNATNLTRQHRARCVHLFREYGARIRIVYLEASEERLLRQNQERPARVPEAVIRRYLERWSVPDRTEAHQVDWLEPR